MKTKTEKNEPIYIDERWPESNEHDGVYYIIAYTTGDGCRHDRTETTAGKLRAIICGCRRNGYQIITCKRIENGTARDVIPETLQEKTDRENRERCKRIAEELEAYAEGRVYRCPNCGECATDNTLFCDCGEQVNLIEGDWEQLSVLDFIQDAYDIEYRVGSDREYRNVKIMVACGGPNIYIDTARRLVTLHWWGDYAEYPISSTACDALDEYIEEYWGCM